MNTVKGAFIWLTIFLLISCIGAAQTKTVPPLVKFSGTLPQSDKSGATVGLTFALYSDQTGGSPLWLETQNVTIDGQGNYSVLIGAAKKEGVPSDLFATNEARWLGVTPEGQDEQPRILLVSVPYALKAGDAETLGGKPLSSFVLNPEAATAGTDTNTVTTSGVKASSANSSVVQTATAGSGTSGYIARWLDASWGTHRCSITATSASGRQRQQPACRSTVRWAKPSA